MLENEEKWKDKVYKATGPDGRGWGDDRKMTQKEQMILEELESMHLKEKQRKDRLAVIQSMTDTKIVKEVVEEFLTEDQKWEK